MTPEKNTNRYQEARREVELTWIDQNTPLFFTKASGYFGLVGRGAIIVDAVARRFSTGALFTYFSKEQMEHIADDEVSGMLETYDPSSEFIVLLLLPQDKKRAYRVCASEEQGLGTEINSDISYART